MAHTPVYLTIRSKDLQNLSAANSYGRMPLQSTITASEDETLVVKLLSFTWPNSFYNLSASLANNTLIYRAPNAISDTTIVVPDGNYCIIELLAYLSSVIPSLTDYTYSEITNKVTLTATSGTTFRFDISPIRRMLGFNGTSYTVTSTLTSDRIVDMTDAKTSLLLRITNLSAQSVIESSHSRFTNVVAVIPIDVCRNHITSYRPQNPMKIALTQGSISDVQIAITFEEGQHVEFNGADWEAVLEISYMKEVHAPRHKTNVDPALLKRMQLHYAEVDKRANGVRGLTQFADVVKQKLSGVKQIDDRRRSNESPST